MSRYCAGCYLELPAALTGRLCPDCQEPQPMRTPRPQPAPRRPMVVVLGGRAPDTDTAPDTRTHVPGLPNLIDFEL